MKLSRGKNKDVIGLKVNNREKGISRKMVYSYIDERYRYK